MMTSGEGLVQIPLLQPEPLAPLPIDSGHYVAALQNKSGELEALQHASPQTWERLTPIIHFVGPKSRTDPFNASSIANWVKKVATAVGSHPVYLDVMRLDATFAVATTKGEMPVLGQIYAAARKRQMSFVPIVRVGVSTEPHINLVADAALQDGHGLALRYRIREVLPPPGMSHRHYLEAQLSRVGSAVDKTDLFVDLDFIDQDVDLDGSDIAATLRELLAVGPWRSVVVLGTSMPSKLGCIPEGTMRSLPRREWEVWSQLEQCDLARMPAFGDYAIQFPDPPREGGGPGMRANIRYTVDGETLIARGKGSVLQEGNEQYQGLCQQLVGCGRFSGRGFSWGDTTIADCASGSLAPGAQNAWRGAGTSHHLQFVTSQLRQRQAAS
jgi:Beta protein